MIMTIVVQHCPKCNNIDIVKNGTDYKSTQKFHCHNCNAYGTLNAKGHYSEDEKATILRAYRERASMRGVERIFGTARQTLARWILEEAAKLPDLADTLEDARPDDILELDELWSFVFNKSNKRWIWIALCRRTRRVVAYYIGDRSEKSCRQLWERIPDKYKLCCSYSDFWHAYQKVFSTQTHHSVGKGSGETNHVERWNNTLRQRLARFVRKTLSFSKSEVYHEAELELYLHYYNTEWCPISQM